MNTLEKMIAEFLHWCEVVNYTPKTIKSYRERFSRLLDWCAQTSITEYHQLDRETLSRYRIFLSENTSTKGDKLSDNSIDCYFGALLVLCEWLYKEGHFEVSPAIYFRNAKRPKKLQNRFLTREEVKRWLSIPDVSTPGGIKLRCILELAYCSGLRASELANLKLEDLDLERKIVRVSEGKGRKDGIGLIGNSALKWLKIYLQRSRPTFVTKDFSEYLFLTRFGEKFTSDGISETPSKLKKKAGIKKHGSLHLLRHSLAAHLLASGVDSQYIREMLRHESIETTRRYLGVGLDDLRREFDDKFTLHDKK